MKCNEEAKRLIITPVMIVLAALIMLPSTSIAKKSSKKIQKMETVEDCSKTFLEAYELYQDDRKEKAEQKLSEIDENCPILQKYIKIYQNKIKNGGGKLCFSDPFEEAENTIDSVQETNDKESSLELGKAYYRLHDYKKAEELFRKSEDLGMPKAKTLQYITSSITRQNRYNDAIDFLRSSRASFKNDKKMESRILFNIAFLLMESAQYKEARETYLELKTKFPKHETEMVRWFAAWSAYRSFDFETSRNEFHQIRSLNRYPWKTRAEYWEAGSLEKLGHTDEALKLYRDILDDLPLNYYGYLSAKKLGKLDEIKKKKISISKLEKEETNDGDICEPLKTAYELSKLGLQELVEMEIEDTIHSKAKQIDWWQAFSLAAENNAWHAANLIARTRFKGLISSDDFYNGDEIEGEPAKAWMGAFPKAYFDDVEKVTDESRLEALLVWAIMREESTFNKNAISPVGAVGLLQLMPFTAKRFSQKDFELEKLATPEMNIKLGVKYLNFLSKEFNKNPIFVIASYNAGEEAVTRWIAQKRMAVTEHNGWPSEMETEFIEEIPYKETRDYVKRVLQSYWTYKILY